MSVSPTHIHNELDNIFQSLTSGWQSPMLMNMHVGVDAASTSTFCLIDIVEFMASSIPNQFAFFDRSLFTHPTDDNDTELTKESWKTLNGELFRVAREAGFKLVSDGYKKSPATLKKTKRIPNGVSPPFSSRVFSCDKRRVYYDRNKVRSSVLQAKHETSGMPMKRTHVHSNSSRGKDGRSGPRRT